ncbi:MAG: hypothetical protein AABY10_01650, partial [Nanoarchaeota archaeon]
YVEDNYELALLASTYASLLNSPLIIQNTAQDKSDNFGGKSIICVGSANPAGGSCEVRYNLDQLRIKYLDETSSDKVILINPSDLNGLFDFNTLKSKHSLASPTLAAAKHELILTTNEIYFYEVNSFLDKKIKELFENRVVRFLTIMASYNYIQRGGVNSVTGDLETYDGGGYGRLNGDSCYDLAAGRISGYSSSDISAYVARSIFSDKLFRNFNVHLNQKGVYPYSSYEEGLSAARYGWPEGLDSKVDGTNILVRVANDPDDVYDVGNVQYITKEKDMYPYELVNYYDHGNEAGPVFVPDPFLSTGMSFVGGCSTCSSLSEVACVHGLSH